MIGYLAWSQAIDGEALLPLLKPFAPDLMQLWAVSPAVGRVSNQGEELIRPIMNNQH